MLGRIFCLVWAHKWHYMYTNGANRAVLHCQRCTSIHVDLG